MTDPGADNTLQGRRVLVVEDELLVAMELDSVLRVQGCTVLGPTATVERAVVLIVEGQPDVALVDLNLGGQSALPIAAVLNARGVPFLVVSGYREPITSARAEPSAAAREAVNHRQLLHALRRVLMESST